MRADGLGGAGGGERRVRDVEGGLGGVAQQPGRGAAGGDVALDPDDGGDVGVPVWGCQSVSASLSVGSKTATARRSSRLRPVSRLCAEPSGAVVAETSWTRWRRVGWLSLTPTIRAVPAVAATSKCFFGGAARRAWRGRRGRGRARRAAPAPPGSRWTSRRCRHARAPGRCRWRRR